MISNLRSEFTVFYLDDGTLGGSSEDIKADLAYIEDAAKDINLFLNCSKSEIICVDNSTCSSMLSVTPSIQVIDPSDATLLGSPIGGTASIDEVLQSKINQLKFLGTRLKLIYIYNIYRHQLLSVVIAFTFTGSVRNVRNDVYVYVNNMADAKSVHNLCGPFIRST